MTPKIYFGNTPSSANYDDNIPIGYNKWDEEEILSSNEEENEKDFSDDSIADVDDEASEQNFGNTPVGSSVEYIMCSAIHYDDGLTYMHQPKNITTGIVLCGRRHHNIVYNWNQLSMGKTKRTDTQGFLTNTDRFVNRNEALQIAILANQIIKRTGASPTELYSEDVW